MSRLQPPETITVDTPEIYCDGSAQTDGERLRGAQSEPKNLGHPRIFLTMTRAGTVDCPYCGRHFVLAAGAKAAAH